jgi:hypothetical protein
MTTYPRIDLGKACGVAARPGKAGACSLLAIAVATLASRPAAAEPTTSDLVGAGVALAVPDYLLGVALHESSHAVAAKLVGADVDELHVFPPGRDPHAGVFRFGWTYVHGLEGRNRRVFFYLAPKLMNSLLLGGIAALAYSSAWPHDRYADVALTVAGTGLWIDFSKDVVPFSRHSDVALALDTWCIHGWREVAARLAYAGVAAAWAVVVVHEYRRTFDAAAPATSALASPLAAVVPIIHAAF